MQLRSTMLLPILAALSFGAVVVPTGVLLWRRAFEPLPQEALAILRLVHHEVLEKYVFEKDADELVMDAVSGMVRELDDYSAFIEPEDVEAFQGSQLEGTYVGIGVMLHGDHVPVTIESPLIGGPAERAQLRPGDRILAVDGEALSVDDPADALEAAVAALRGEAGSTSRLRIGRGDEGATFEVDVMHEEVAQPRVKWLQLVDPEQRLGYVYIEGFQRGVAEAFDAAIADLRAEAGGALRGLILDLRHDPGGLLDEAIALANRFLAEGEIVSLRGRDSAIVEQHLAQPELCTLPDLPLVVLIDGGSASASEVVTGALQDHGRARIVGVRSYGKGLVQSVLGYRGYDFLLRLSTSHYYTPNGRSIERRLRRSGDGEAEGGIAPDVVVELDRQTARFVASRLRRNEVPRRYREAARAASAAIDRELGLPLTADEDPQLQAAVAELRALVREGSR